MAGFHFDGIDTLTDGLDKLGQLSEEEKFDILRPAAELLVEKQKKTIRSLFRQVSGALADSIVFNLRAEGEGAVAHIFLKGKHPKSSTGKRFKHGRSAGKYSGTNAEVGYILEHGSPRIQATHWMENTNDEAEDDVIAAEQEAWDNIVTKKGL